MTVNALRFEVLRAVRGPVDRVTDDPHRAVHHLLAIQAREFLRPPEIRDVVIEFRCPFREVRKIAIGQRHAGGCRPLLRFPDVEVADLVADAARA
jgi:hypothetical protein